MKHHRPLGSASGLGVSPMDENVKARDPEEQAVTTGQPWELGHGHGREGWPDQLAEPGEPAHDMFELLQGKVPGHRWDGWRRLTGDEGYFAACSCGWRSPETGSVSPVLCQVKEHLDAAGAVRGWRPSAVTAQVAGRDERERGAGQRGMRPGERNARAVRVRGQPAKTSVSGAGALS